MDKDRTAKEKTADEARAAAASLRLVAADLRRARRTSLTSVANALARHAETLAQEILK